MEVFTVKLNEATIALRAGEDEVARLKSEYSDKESEATKLRHSLDEINSQATRELEDLNVRTSALGAEASSIFETLKNWCATPK